MDLIKFFETASRMKDVERTGWVARGVKNPETSADHTFMVALMVLILGKGRKLNLDKAVKMALVHDLPEAIVGDIISKDKWETGGKMWKKDIAKLERKAMKKLSLLSGSQEILEIWKKFDEQRTPEAIFVDQADRLATIIQAMEYFKKGNHKKTIDEFSIEKFWGHKELSNIKDPDFRKLLDSFLSEKK
jgi:putative hydrolase of HD superfamily